jgi:hypothetical protein
MYRSIPYFDNECVVVCEVCIVHQKLNQLVDTARYYSLSSCIENYEGEFIHKIAYGFGVI